MVTTGVTGTPWRASISPWGAVQPWDRDDRLDWFVAADDRWHVPSDESAVRQVRLEGTAVTETRVRVPNGDVVQRVYSVADHGGLTVVEVENESTMPVAIAFNRRDVLTERPIVDMPIEGIDLPRDAFVMPLGHAASLRVGVSHREARSGALPPGLPSALQVVRGWLSLIERASRFVLPDGERGAAVAGRITALRCELGLGSIPRADDDPAGFAVALGELVRMGEDPEHWIPELVDAVERVGPVAGWYGDVALDAAARVLAASDERRARADLDRITSSRTRATRPTAPPRGACVVPWLESSLSHGGALLPLGLPAGWLGQAIEAYGLPSGDLSTVSFAIRWHGERPAVLWEQAGEPIELTAPELAPSWTTVDAKGEALWPPPAAVVEPRGGTEGPDAEPGPDVSFN